MTGGAPPRLRVGPLLRWVDATRATVWVETDRPGCVQVLDAKADTWCVHGHFFAVVVVEGLAPGSTTAYDVRLDGEQVWPLPDDPRPAPTIRTLPSPDDARPLRLAFGSCRALAGYDDAGLASHGADALVALAQAVLAGEREPPDLLLHLGDQVYADHPDGEIRARLRRRPDVDPEVREEACSFEEYSWLYERAWTQPDLRWLLSSVPSAMMLDDHDLRDDWNTSYAWRRRMTARPWWGDRVAGGLGAYWVYQHLGNLSPDALDAEPTYRAVRAATSPEERDAAVDEMARRADREPETHPWSYVRGLGRTRIVAIDSRCARSLGPLRRAMLDDASWQWLDEQLRGDIDHLVVATSLPWLLLPAVHELEGWNEATAAGAWGRPFAAVAERLRTRIDLEHWAAFRQSFDALTAALVGAARGVGGGRPASVLVLSGDVHLSYAARARFPGDGDAAPLWQLVMSPFRNPLSDSVRRANRILARRSSRLALTWVARRARVAPPAVRWRLDYGPVFDNGVSTVVLEGRAAVLHTDAAVVTADGRQALRRAVDEELATG